MELHVHLNGDEAMSFGAAFIASNSSSSFKVRKVYLTQHPKYDIRVKITPLNSEAADLRKQERSGSEESEEDAIEYEKETTLYRRSDYLGQKKTIHLNYDVDMLIEATAIHPDGSEEALASFELNEISSIMEKDVMKEPATTKPKLSLSFELSRSHLFQLLSAKVNVEETRMEEVIPLKEDKKDPKKKKAKKDGDDDKKEDEEKEEDAAEETPAEETDDAKAEDEPEEPEKEKEYKEVKVPHTFDVDSVAETFHGCRLLSKDQKKEAGKRIKELDQRDKDKMMADEAKNTYESQIYSLRSWLREEENEVYVAEEERESLLTKLDDGEEWLYDEGAQLHHTKYQERSYELTKEMTKFNKRRNEHTAREKQIPKLLEALDESRSKAHQIREYMPWVTEQEQEDLVSKVEETRDFIDKKMDEQSKLGLTDDPSFSMDQVDKEMTKLNKLAKKIFGKKKPKEPKKKKTEEDEEAAKNEETTDANDDEASKEEANRE